MRYFSFLLSFTLFLNLEAAPAHSETGSTATDWECRETLFQDSTIIVEKVCYRSQGHKIWGQVCRPKRGGRHKTLVFNHSGFEGLGEEWAAGSSCRQRAREGIVVLQSSYRGEDNSEGKIEVCLGEVDDVLNLIDVALGQPYVDPARLIMFGVSHGGCITTRAVQRGAPVVAAINVSGPTDWATNYRLWQRQLAAGTGAPAPIFKYLINVLNTAIGGSPDQFPTEYAKRSPLNFASELDQYPHPFMMLQGTADALVHVSEPCRLAAAVPNFSSYRVGVNGKVITSPPVGCESSKLTWVNGLRPTLSWPGNRHLVIYDGVGHNVSADMVRDSLTFLSTKAP